uniref:3-mercaptopyruvate sulfurtransferase n=1 Tax=Stygiella incarcerata TaxID=1712417 RepID=A0A192ZJE2_9EUKA|nr:3-mercaptopyruvate sulfurtransferase [Stygiella incarcerata]
MQSLLLGLRVAQSSVCSHMLNAFSRTLSRVCDCHFSPKPCSPLVSPKWVESHMKKSEEAVRLIDASWYMPFMERDAKQEFLRRRIPGAVFFDIDTVAETSTGLPHMLPKKEIFEAEMRRIGVRNDDHVVVYDGAGQFSSARLYYTFLVFGHCYVSILDGGFPKWEKDGCTTDRNALQHLDDAIQLPKSVYSVSGVKEEHVWTLSQVMQHLNDPAVQVVDARSNERFCGRVDEPRPECARGSIPGSFNVPFDQVLGSDGTFLRPKDIRRAFLKAGINVDAEKLVFSCGSGVTASILFAAAERMGIPRSRLAVYDGSWAEWGSIDDTPKQVLL